MSNILKGKAKHWQLVTVILAIYDFIAVCAAYFLALWIRFDCHFQEIPGDYLNAYYKTILLYALFCIVIFSLFHLYKSIWRFASYRELLRTASATVVTWITYLVIMHSLVKRMPVSYYLFGVMAQFGAVLGIRFSYRFVLLLCGRNAETQIPAKRVMIVGAGAAGKMIFHDIRLAKELNEKVCCFIDDNPNKWGRFIDEVKVEGGRDHILEMCEKYSIEKIYITIPSATAEQKRDIINICHETSCELKTLPGLYQLSNGEVTVEKTKKVAVEDLLGRDPIKVNREEILNYLKGKVVLVTGGGGSIGSELCRQIAAHEPKRLIIFDIYENNAYDIQQELKRNYPELDLHVIIGSVRDSRKVYDLFEIYRPQIVYHAAAHKHVPLMEDSPCESIKNNVMGTYKTAYAAIVHGCERFVLISTDKAVNPTNIMGASKRMCEMCIQSMNEMIKQGRAEEIPQILTKGMQDLLEEPKTHEALITTRTEFVAVRFGNVLGSNGSVIPLFKKQIAAGGPVTVTHPDIIRYFMTIPEAVGLVLEAGIKAHGGEIFILDMGEPVKIDTLARNLIRLSGYTPDVDIKIEYTGLRPGEKLFEEKLMAEEGLRKTANSLIHIGKPVAINAEKFFTELEEISEAAFRNDKDIREYVMRMIGTYHPVGIK